MRSLTANLISQKNTIRDGSAWVMLVELEEDEASYLRYTNNIDDITFDSQTWTHINMGMSTLKSDGSGNISPLQLSMDNTDRVLIAYLESDDIRGHGCRIYIVNTDNLSSASDCIIFRGVVVDAAANKDVVTFNLGHYDIRKVAVPRRVFSRLFCPFIFKGPECQYAGGVTTCAKTEAACTALSNLANTGAFLSMPTILR